MTVFMSKFQISLRHNNLISESQTRYSRDFVLTAVLYNPSINDINRSARITPSSANRLFMWVALTCHGDHSTRTSVKSMVPPKDGLACNNLPAAWTKAVWSWNISSVPYGMVSRSHTMNKTCTNWLVECNRGGGPDLTRLTPLINLSIYRWPVIR